MSEMPTGQQPPSERNQINLAESQSMSQNPEKVEETNPLTSNKVKFAFPHTKESIKAVNRDSFCLMKKKEILDIE